MVDRLRVVSLKPTTKENKMAKTPLESLDELIIRLNQSRRDGKMIVGIETLEHALKLVVRAIREK